MGSTLPKNLKKILEFQGYDNLVALSKLTTASVEGVTSFVREFFVDMIPSNELPSYILPFKDASKFSLLPGHKLLFEPIGEAALCP